mmetsp:Transcript_12358/g.11193  ORF Transcript_12358/g.11193 Transcript_12358/m.11193 type:complete len:378 (-) Transcript_12358:63-1196(-)
MSLLVDGREIWYGPSNNIIFNDEELDHESSIDDDTGDDTEDENSDDNIALDELYQSNLNMFNDYKQSNTKWAQVPIEEQEGKFEIRKPTASEMYHGILYPQTYRCLKPIADLDDIPDLLNLDVSNAAIQERIDKVLVDEDVLACLDNFCRTGQGESEQIVELRFNTLVMTIIIKLKSCCSENVKIQYSVGGLLADESYAVIGYTDNLYKNENGDLAISTEANTARSWRSGQIWYLKSRAIQTFGALFSTKSPTFLYNQNEFKFFLIDKTNGGVFTYPANHSTCDTFSEDFIKLIIYCLLSSSIAVTESKNIVLKKGNFRIPTERVSYGSSQSSSKRSFGKRGESKNNIPSPNVEDNSECDWLPLTVANVRRLKMAMK